MAGDQSQAMAEARNSAPQGAPWWVLHASQLRTAARVEALRRMSCVCGAYAGARASVGQQRRRIDSWTQDRADALKQSAEGLKRVLTLIQMDLRNHFPRLIPPPLPFPPSLLPSLDLPHSPAHLFRSAVHTARAGLASLFAPITQHQQQKQQGLRTLPFARISPPAAPPAAAAAAQGQSGDADGAAQGRAGMAPEQIARRLDGIPVFTVCNPGSEFVLISDQNGSKSLALFCFRQEDASALLTQLKQRDPSLGRGARVVPVALDKVYLLAAEGIAFRFLPDPAQVKHAIKLLGQAGDSNKAFNGVPVFQSDNLILRIKNRRFSPIFFAKEDLEMALRRALRQNKRANPTMRPGTAIQVGSFEAVLKDMEKNEEDSPWGSLLFVPPGMDAESQLKAAFG